jgi:5-methylthioribose kinase
MASLTPDPDFQGVVARLLGVMPEALVFTPLTGGVSSDIWRVDGASQTVCAKRALPRLRVQALWEAPVRRNAEEVRWLTVARTCIGEQAARVIGHDVEAGVALLEWYPPDQWRNWKLQLLSGEIDRRVAAALGTALGSLDRMASERPGIAAEFANHDLFDALRIDPFFRHIAHRYARMPDVVDYLVTARETLVHGDFSPKNVLIDLHGSIRILDAETATYGSAAFDPGYLIAHLLLKFARTPQPELAAAALDVWDHYQTRLHGRSEGNRPDESRVIDIITAMILARIDGKSPVDYLTPRVQSRLRDQASALLARPPSMDVRPFLTNWLTQRL